MEEVFNFDSLRSKEVISVSKATFTVRDRRTGKLFDMTIYRPHANITGLYLDQFIDKYGYEVYASGDLKTVTCDIPWDEVYETYLKRAQEEECND